MTSLTVESLSSSDLLEYGTTPKEVVSTLTEGSEDLFMVDSDVKFLEDIAWHGIV